MLTNEDIKYISDKIDVPKYDRAMMEYNNGRWRWEGKDFPRIPALIEFRKMVDELKLISKKMLILNDFDDPELEFIETDKIVSCVYDNNPSEYDLHIMDLDEKDFDFVMCNQTLEHLYNPYVCLKTINKHIRSGGYFYANVPSNNIPHSTPYHFFTGITSSGLGAMIVESGFEIVKLGQWGNSHNLIKLFTDGWIDYTKSIWDNDVDYPIICWVLARKL